MGTSLYHYAFRETPLSCREHDRVKEIVARFMEELGPKADPYEYEYFWESPAIYELDNPAYKPHRPNTILSGSTGVRTGEQVEYWAKMVSEFRKVILNAEWEVHLECENLIWDESDQLFRLPPRPKRQLHRVYFSQSTLLEGGEFIRLAAESLNLPSDSGMDIIEDRLIERYGDDVELRFTHDDSVSSDRIQELQGERLLWAVLGQGPRSDRVETWWQDQVGNEDEP